MEFLTAKGSQEQVLLNDEVIPKIIHASWVADRRLSERSQTDPRIVPEKNLVFELEQAECRGIGIEADMQTGQLLNAGEWIGIDLGNHREHLIHITLKSANSQVNLSSGDTLIIDIDLVSHHRAVQPIAVPVLNLHGTDNGEWLSQLPG